MWAALVLSISPKAVALAVGSIAFLIGAWPAGAFRQLSFLIGVGTLSGVMLLSGGPVSQRPSPTPRPVDPVVIDTNFEKEVLSRFDGTTAEAQVIAALCDQYANSLAFDSDRAKPRINTTADLGMDWAELQRYRGASETPWGQKFKDLKDYASKQLEDIGVTVSGKPTKLDERTKEKAAQFYRDLASALLKVKK